MTNANLVSTVPSAAVASPFLAWVWVVHRSGGRRPTVRGFAVVVVVVVSTVVMVFGLCTVLAGVDLGWIAALGGNSDLEPWLSVPTALGELTGAVLNLFTEVDPARLIARFRLVGWGLLAGLVAWLWWRSRDGGAAAVRGAALALMATVLFSPVVFLWYFTWPLALGAAVTWSASRIAAASAVSVWLVLSTHPDGKTLLPPWGFGAVLVLSVLVGVMLTPQEEVLRRVFSVRGSSRSPRVRRVRVGRARVGHVSKVTASSGVP